MPERTAFISSSPTRNRLLAGGERVAGLGVVALAESLKIGFRALGISAKAGRSFDYEGYDWKRAKQQRWRVGVQRETVRSVLATTPFVRHFADAPPEAGGWGATVVHLSRDG